MGLISPAIRKLAILRALQLGDLLCAVPALRALRAGLPEAEITLIGLPWARDFVRRFDSYVDGFLEFPGHPGAYEVPFAPAKSMGFFQSVAERPFDLAV